jgi:hypothetical protein
MVFNATFNNILVISWWSVFHCVETLTVDVVILVHPQCNLIFYYVYITCHSWMFRGSKSHMGAVVVVDL